MNKRREITWSLTISDPIGAWKCNFPPSQVIGYTSLSLKFHFHTHLISRYYSNTYLFKGCNSLICDKNIQNEHESERDGLYVEGEHRIMRIILERFVYCLPKMHFFLLSLWQRIILKIYINLTKIWLRIMFMLLQYIILTTTIICHQLRCVTGEGVGG